MASKTGDRLDEAARARRLAEDARRIAELMHQVQVRRDLFAQAEALEREALKLEGAAREGDGAVPARPPLRVV